MYKIITNLLTPNNYSRPQKKLNSIKALVIHYVANPNSSALANRNFFENRKNGNTGYGSAHEIIDLNGDVLICIPDNEMSYNCGSDTYTDRKTNELGNSNPNYVTYGIECTHINNTGKMSDATYNTLIERCADLCIKYKLDPLKNIWTHKEVVGWKDCHLWFVKNPNEWIKFKNLVSNKIYGLKNPTIKKTVNTDTLNVRSTPSVKDNSNIVGKLEKNKVVEVYQIVDGWAKIKFNNKDAYVSNQYLK